MPAPPFVAHASRRGIVILVAAMMPLVVAVAAAMVFHPQAPLAARIAGAVIVSPVVIWLGLSLRLLFRTAPILEIDERGLFSWRWSAERIPWEQVDRWKAKRYLGSNFVTLWLKDPSRNRPGFWHGVFRPGNKGLGFGDVAISGGGMDRTFEEMLEAFQRFAPRPPLPADERLARRLRESREREERRRAP